MTDEELLRIAYRRAQQSPDPSTQNGGVLVGDFGQIIAYSCNEFPRGVLDLPERWERPLKYSVIEHAERNLIYEAAARGLATAGSTMYVPWVACADCARAIIQAGIGRLVRHADATVHGNVGASHWDDSISIADQMLIEADIDITEIVGKLMPNDFFIRHAGEDWSP